MKDYSKVIVPKPWGKEYLLFDEFNVAGWILHVNKGEKTSLHCHPKKKTSLIVLEGDAVISFLTSNISISKGEKTIIREGVFHSTTALTDLVLLEIETPVDKGDLVRLVDSYGRAGKPYEVENIPRGSLDFLEFDNLRSTAVGACELYLKENETLEDNFSLVIFFEPGIVLGDVVIAGPGDCLTKRGFDKLSKRFEVNRNARRLEINV